MFSNTATLWIGAFTNCWKTLFPLKSRLFLCPAKTIVVLVNDSQGMVTIGSSSLVGEFELRRD